MTTRRLPTSKRRRWHSVEVSEAADMDWRSEQNFAQIRQTKVRSRRSESTSDPDYSLARNERLWARPSRARRTDRCVSSAQMFTIVGALLTRDSCEQMDEIFVFALYTRLISFVGAGDSVRFLSFCGNFC
jgi:hypothetical protein